MLLKERKFAARTIVCATLLLAQGCGGPAPISGPQAHPVQGKVIYHGKPTEGFRVAFHPLTSWEGPAFAPSAVTDANGEFHLHSYGNQDGAPAGEYAVTFSWPQAMSTGDPDDAPRQVDRLGGALSDPAKARIRAAVHEGQNTLEPFVLP